LQLYCVSATLMLEVSSPYGLAGIIPYHHVVVAFATDRDPDGDVVGSVVDDPIAVRRRERDTRGSVVRHRVSDRAVGRTAGEDTDGPAVSVYVLDGDVRDRGHRAVDFDTVARPATREGMTRSAEDDVAGRNLDPCGFS